MGTGLLAVKSGFILFIKDYQIFTQSTRLRERESYQPTILLIRGLSYQLLLIVGKFGQGMRSCKCTNHDLYAGGCE